MAVRLDVEVRKHLEIRDQSLRLCRWPSQSLLERFDLASVVHQHAESPVNTYRLGQAFWPDRSRLPSDGQRLEVEEGAEPSPEGHANLQHPHAEPGRACHGDIPLPAGLVQSPRWTRLGCTRHPIRPVGIANLRA